MGVGLPLVEPPSEPFAVERGALLGAKVDAAVGTCVAVAKLQSPRGAHAKLASVRWSEMHSSRLATCLEPLLTPPLNWACQGEGAGNVKVATVTSQGKRLSKKPLALVTFLQYG